MFCRETGSIQSRQETFNLSHRDSTESSYASLSPHLKDLLYGVEERNRASVYTKHSSMVVFTCKLVIKNLARVKVQQWRFTSHTTSYAVWMSCTFTHDAFKRRLTSRETLSHILRMSTETDIWWKHETISSGTNFCCVTFNSTGQLA